MAVFCCELSSLTSKLMSHTPPPPLVIVSRRKSIGHRSLVKTAQAMGELHEERKEARTNSKNTLAFSLFSRWVYQSLIGVDFIIWI